MTIKDLAARSGYAVGTVSRVLNNQPNVSEKARRTILAIARAEGFELNSNAKNLKQQRSNSLLAVVRGVYNQLFADLVEHLQSLTAGGDYRLVVDYIDEGKMRFAGPAAGPGAEAPGDPVSGGQQRELPGLFRGCSSAQRAGDQLRGRTGISQSVQRHHG